MFTLRSPVSSLDVRLGVRMLVRYPVLTLVGGLAMAFAIAAGAGTFEVLRRATDPVLPLPDGDRLVGFAYWDTAESAQKPATAYDFAAWRADLRTVQDVGAFRLQQRNLAAGNEGGEPAEVAEISAAAFRVTRVPPLLGRALVEADEDPRAAPVMVVGYRLWQTRFGADPAIVGRVVRLGDLRATVVGVMPEGFAFPFSQHLWTPLKPADLPHEPGRAPLRVFGRLAPGASLREAEAEMATLTARAAAAFPKHYANLKPQVLPYAESMIWIPPDFLVRAGIQAINAFAALFLVVVCGNVALLMFARAATREREILVRGALGASRSRIVMQLFAEALVLGTLAAGVGLAATHYGLTWLLEASSSESEGWPFWIQGGLSATTLTYAALLTLLASAVAGIVPALKITGRGIEVRLREVSAGGGGLRMGGMWTGLIVAQIAGTVLFAAVAFVAHRQAAQIAATKAAFPAEEYLAMRLDMDRTPAQEPSAASDDEFLKRYSETVRALERRLAADASLASVTIADRLPLLPQRMEAIEVEEPGAAPSSERRSYAVATTGVDPNFFAVFQAHAVAGQLFTSPDLRARANQVVVNRLFVEQVLNGRNAIGRRIRTRPRPARTGAEPGPWLEIGGVVPDLVVDTHAPLRLDNPAKPGVYLPLAPASYPVYLAARVRGPAATFAPALRRIAADLSPALRLDEIQPLSQATSGDARVWRVLANVIISVSAIALFLSLAGIYAVMSFTVTRRTREIAVRLALGAQARTILVEILRRPLLHVAAGAALGCVPLAGLMALSMRGSQADIGSVTERAALLAAYALVMTAVCALACVGPARRVLRVEPTEALREEQ